MNEFEAVGTVEDVDVNAGQVDALEVVPEVAEVDEIDPAPEHVESITESPAEDATSVHVAEAPDVVAAYDYTDVYAEETSWADCETGDLVVTFSQVQMGVKVREDGLTQWVDLGYTPEVYTDYYQATPEQLELGGCIVEPVEQSETVASVAAETPVPVERPELAVTGGADVALWGIGALILVAGAALMSRKWWAR